MRVLPLALVFAATPLAAAEPVTGSWITQSRDGVVEIAQCGASVCGKLVRFLVTPPGGIDQRDTENPDPALRNRKVLGLAILTGFKADKKIWRGRIYDPKRGKSYRSELKRVSADRLEVKGCIGPFCQTQVWRRAD